MRRFLIALVCFCALGVGLTVEADKVMEEVSFCYSETPVYYYQRQCEMQVYNDYFAGALTLALYEVSR